MAFLASDNHARTQETDASHDALNHAAGIAAGYRMDRQNGQGRAETQDAEGADASRLSMQIAVEPERDSKQGRSTEPKCNVESVHSRKILAPRRAEGSPVICSATDRRLLIALTRLLMLNQFDGKLGRGRKLGCVTEALRAGFQAEAIIGRRVLLVSVSVNNQSREFCDGIAFSVGLGTFANHRFAPVGARGMTWHNLQSVQ
jgi:hypothetical protein